MDFFHSLLKRREVHIVLHQAQHPPDAKRTAGIHIISLLLKIHLIVYHIKPRLFRLIQEVFQIIMCRIYYGILLFTSGNYAGISSSAFNVTVGTGATTAACSLVIPLSILDIPSTAVAGDLRDLLHRQH